MRLYNKKKRDRMKPLTLQRYFIKGEHSIRSRPSMGAYKNGAHKTIVLKNTFTFKIVHIFHSYGTCSTENNTKNIIQQK